MNKTNYYKKYKKKIKDDDDEIDTELDVVENLDHPFIDDNDSENLDSDENPNDHDGHEDDEEEEEEEKTEEEKIKEKIKRKNNKKLDKAKFYVEPKKFDEEIMLYYGNGIISNDLAEMISKISNKLSYAPNFINYSYREEMVGDGIIRMMKALIAKKYSHDKGNNPFSYFTRIAFNAFRNRIKKEKKMHETHEKYRRELMHMSSNYSNLLRNNNISIMKERDRFLE